MVEALLLHGRERGEIRADYHDHVEDHLTWCGSATSSAFSHARTMSLSVLGSISFSAMLLGLPTSLSLWSPTTCRM